MKNRIMASLVLGSFLLMSCVSPQDAPEKTTLGNEKSEKVRCPGGIAENSDGYGGGDGTKENPYLICTVDQFKAIRGNMETKRFFKLTSDIDFSSEQNLRIVALAPFASIDGANHKLSHISIQHGYGYKDNGI